MRSKIRTWARPRRSPVFLGHCCVGDSCQPLPSALRHWYPQLVGISTVLPRGGCLLQHLLNLGLGLCDSLLNLLCYPPPGVCSHGIFIFCCLRLINKALESCSSHTHTTESSPVHPPQLGSGLLSDQVHYSPFLYLSVHPPPPCYAPTHNPPRCPHLAPSVTAVAEGKERWSLPPPNQLPGRALAKHQDT